MKRNLNKLQLRKTTVSNLDHQEMNNAQGGTKLTFANGCSTQCSMVAPGCVSFPTEEFSVCNCVEPVAG